MKKPKRTGRRLARAESCGVNEDVRDAARQVLELLREKEFKSAADAQKSSGLPSVRFARAMRWLTKNGIVETIQAGVAPRGVRRGVLRIRQDYGYVAAVDIGGTNLRLVIADMAGTIAGKWSGSTVGARSPRKVVQLVHKGVKWILRRARLREGSLLAIAAGAPGVTDSKNGVVRLTSYLGGWKNVPLARLLEKKLGIPAVVENDVRLGAVGEKWRGSARGVTDFVFLAIGTGIAAGICVNGELLRGPEFAAGEVGYLIVPGTRQDGTAAGNPGALESAIGGEGIKAQWQQATQTTHEEGLSDLSATEIFDRAVAGDERARRVLDRSAQILAHAVYDISVVLNCPLFILGGGVGTSAFLRDATEAVLSDYSQPVRPELCLSSLGPDAQLFGALRLALDAAEKRIGLRD
jgi:glucokinase